MPNVYLASTAVPSAGSTKSVVRGSSDRAIVNLFFAMVRMSTLSHCLPRVLGFGSLTILIAFPWSYHSFVP